MIRSDQLDDKSRKRRESRNGCGAAWASYIANNEISHGRHLIVVKGRQLAEKEEVNPQWVSINRVRVGLGQYITPGAGEGWRRPEEDLQEPFWTEIATVDKGSIAGDDAGVKQFCS